jgi:hypothetical protein
LARVEAAVIAIGGMDDIAGAQLALGGLHEARGAVLHRNCRTVFKNARPGGLSGIGQDPRRSAADEDARRPNQ